MPVLQWITQSGKYCATMQRSNYRLTTKKGKGRVCLLEENWQHNAVCGKRQTYEDYECSQGDSGVRDESGHIYNTSRI